VSSILRAASVVSALTLLSRILGFIRDVLMYRLLGATWVSGTFTYVWMFPNLLRTWFGEGALSASFLPAFTRARAQHGEAAGRSLLASVLGVLLLLLGAFTCLAVLVALCLPPEWLHMRAVPGQDGADSTTHGRFFLDLVAILFPYSLPICVAAILGGVLNALGSFAAAAAVPALLNIVWITGLVVAAATCDTLADAARLMSAFLLLGGLLQLALVALPLWRRGLLPHPRLPARGDPARAVFQTMLPAVLGLSIGKLGVLINIAMARHLISPQATNFVYLADRLLLFPYALTSLALVTAVFPRLAELAARGERQQLRARVNESLQIAWFLTVPSSVGLMLVGDSLFSICFASERFTAADVRLAAATTTCMVAGLPFLSCAQLLARALYALGDVRRPARIAIVLFAVNLALNLLFVLGLETGVQGLPLATSICSLLNASLLYALVHATAGGPHLVLWPYLRVLLATAIMAPIVVFASGWFPATGGLGRAAGELLLPVAAGIAGYLVVHGLLGGRELRGVFHSTRTNSM
jgi:putative peptidoglycan lipid II flippase